MFYVKDRGNNNGINYFNTLEKTIAFLEKYVQTRYSMSRTQWMQHFIDLGHGYDDSDGKTFVASLENELEIGIVNKSNKHVKCDIHGTLFSNPEYGD